MYDPYFSKKSIEIIFAAQEKNGEFLSVIKKIRIVHIRLFDTLEYILLQITLITYFISPFSRIFRFRW